jgi:multiple sugar transport system permease protein
MGPRRQWHIRSWVMFSPYLFLLVAFGLAPILLSIQSSLGASMANPDGGLDTYLLVLKDFRFLPALKNVAIFLAIYLPIMMIVVTFLALLLDTRHDRSNRYVMLGIIVPAAITGSVAILVWYFMLEPNLSPFRDALHAFGITAANQIWNTGNLAYIFAAIAFFTGAGYWVLIQYGSLQSISDEVLEAARLDSANAWQMAVFIKLPLIKKYLVFMMVLTFAAGLQLFVEPQLISSSVYPGIARAWTLNQLSYDLAFSGVNFAGAAALSLLLLLACLAAALILIAKTDFFDRSGGRAS